MIRSFTMNNFFRKSSCLRNFSTSLFKLKRKTGEEEKVLPSIFKMFFQTCDYELIPIVKDRNTELSREQLLVSSKILAKQITEHLEKKENNVAFLTTGISSIITQYSIWFSGSVCVPLCKDHPLELMEYFITDSEASLIVCDLEFESRLKPLAQKLRKPLLIIDTPIKPVQLDSFEKAKKNLINNPFFYEIDKSAIIIYTSGTTSKPKGVLMTHANIEAQISCLSQAWKMSSNDTVLHTLPLHHVHGLINALILPLAVGAKIIMMPKFETANVWSHLLNINSPLKDRISVFMAVPTTYNYLIQEYDKLFEHKPQMKEHIRNQCSKIRLMISGSASLPKSTFNRWKDITGHNLLERYGMTEIGMAISNPLHEDKTRKRLPGFVGLPLPLVQVRVVSYENNEEVLMEIKGEFNKGIWSNDEKDHFIEKRASFETVGNLQIKGPGVFKEYFNKTEATKESFTSDGWFMTGDSVLFSNESNSFKILGRNSVDIIKTKGYKVSALEIEAKLLENPLVKDCAVIGISDNLLGQKVIALVALYFRSNDEKSITEMDKWCQEKFASYSLPSIKIVETVPRNLMGKVDKSILIKSYSL